MGTTILNEESCRCCGGSGIQRNKQTEINEICKCCGGEGKMYDKFYKYPIITC